MGFTLAEHILEDRSARDINDYSYEEVELELSVKPLTLRGRRKRVTSF